MMKTFFLAMLTILGMIMALPALAMDLQQARAAGFVGETLGGYVAVLKPTPETVALAESVNAKRRQEYARISRENSQPVDVIARLAAEQIINNLDAGQYHQAADGSWKKR